MKNENPQQLHRRVEDRLAAMKAGKSCRIVVFGKCKVCKRRSADVPATANQALAWFKNKETGTFLKYEVRMLTEGLHRDCQKVADAKAKAKAFKVERAANYAVPLDADKIERIAARRKARQAA